MGRAVRKTSTNNIVIVCEGSDTEPNYLNEVRNYVQKTAPDRFTDIRIVPFGSEAKEAAARNSKSKRKNRKLKDSVVDSDYYWVMPEKDKDAFEKYSVQPARYVREAQLFLDNGYTEAWAIYDKDKFDGHEIAEDLAKSSPGLNIAISCISFEEWLLLHFERNPKAFSKSCCKRDKKDLGCGTPKAGIDDCKGNLCVIGYLRHSKYIPDFEKSKRDLFSSYTLPKLNFALINAAWVRTLSSDVPRYLQNPYTDFDILLCRLLGIDTKFFWQPNAMRYHIGRLDFSLTSSKDVLTISAFESPVIGEYYLADKLGKTLSSNGMLSRIQISPNGSLNIPINDKVCYFIIVDGPRHYVFPLSA